MNFNKINKKKIGSILIVFLIILNSYLMIGANPTWPAFNICCEKTKNGAWCQNSLAGSCDDSFDSITGSKYRSSPTSCDATSFCRLGCCIDTSEGLCMENSPQRVCQQSTGTWVEDAKCNVPQCRLGCCLLGDQASFVTLTRCKRLSNIYGLSTNFKKEITNEAQCIMMAYSQDKGACVYESEGMRTCIFTTRQECTNTKKTGNITTNGEFFKDYLCSADELGANCGPTTETMCIPGRDEVYFRDTCGNPANIYDANRVYSRDPGYWKKLVSKSDSCNSGSGNINSRTCGNCDYLKGSLCGNGKASYGSKICRDLNCYKTQNGKSYKNGESWCEYQSETGNGQDLVGSRSFRHVCIHGEETIEPCADFRNEICIEGIVKGISGNFIEAGCRPNRWQDCIDQFTEKDCTNTDKRDCYWLNGYHYDGSASSKNTSNPEKADTTQKEEEKGGFFSGGALGNIFGNNNDDNSELNKGILKNGSICLPNVPPGLKFWDSTDAKAICSLGNSKQTVTYEEDFFGNKKCVKNCEVLTSAWANDLNTICSSLGDCGAKSNLVGEYTEGGYSWKIQGKVQTINTGILETAEE